MRSLVFAVWGVALCVFIAGAQPVARKEPSYYAGTERVSRVEARPPGIRLGLAKAREYALAPLSASEASLLAEPGTRLRAGIHRSLSPQAISRGSWETTREGTRVWRMAIRSPGSTGVRVEFRNFSVGEGKVWVDDGVHSAGPYSGTGLFDDGHFWSGTVPSESVTLEYVPAPGAPTEGAPPFEVRTISHQARKTLLATDAGSTDPADYCHLDPNCYPDWKPAMSMVGQLTFEESGSEYLCSGSLVATRDNSFKPYLLTAGHCIHSEDAARTLEVYWTYQTSSCGATPPASRDSSSKSTVGAHLLASSSIEQGDYSLVLLKDVPGGVTFSGWDVADPPVTTPLVGIHHPVGSWKRISFGERVGDFTADVEGDTAPASDYLEILWDKGRTEPGSSGSPLFSSPGVIVGTLTYGPASPTLSACQIDPSIDGYGRFSNTYPNIKDYLEDLPAALVTPDKSPVQFSVTNGAAPPAQTVRLTTASTGQVTFKLRADEPWIKISTLTGTLSASAPVPLAISVDPTQFDQPDQYTGTVTILSGAAPPQFINVTAAVQQAQSNVVASVTPSTVTQSNGLWSFTIRLSETGGAATHLTAMKINGTDYSANIAGWFGTDQIASRSAIQAPLQAPASFPLGTYYIEFWGADVTTGLTWYRTAAVTLQ
jgi:hypothetical protein